MEHVTSLPSCVILATGRTGSDFLQSLLDSHPELLVFNGVFFFHDFWNKSKCRRSVNFNLSDFLDEFIGHHIEKFISTYDTIENKGLMGVNKDQSIRIDLNTFKSHAIHLLDGYENSSRNVLIAIYASYALSLNQDVMQTRVHIHHLHHYFRLPDYLLDFPDSKVISTTRDPRANFVSSVRHWSAYREGIFRGGLINHSLRKIQRDELAEKLCVKGNHRALKLEDLGDTRTLEMLTQWLGVRYSDSMKISSFGGILWHGDALSTGVKTGTGFSKQMAHNQWRQILSRKDQYLFNVLMNRRLESYGYSHRKITIISLLITPLLILLPLTFEKELFSISYIKVHINEHRLLAHNFISYIRRVGHFASLYKELFSTKSWPVKLISIIPTDSSKNRALSN